MIQKTVKTGITQLILKILRGEEFREDKLEKSHPYCPFVKQFLINKEGPRMVNQSRQLWRLLGGWAVGLFLLAGVILLFASPVEAGIGAITEYNLRSNSFPNYIVSGSDGDLWFTDVGYDYSNIGKVDPSTGEVTEYTIGLNSGSAPNYIVSGPDGNLWFADGGTTPAIGKVNQATGEITEYSAGLNSGSAPNYIETGPDGNLWFTDNGSIKAIGKIDPATGAITEYSTDLSGSSLYIIVAGPDGNLWFTDCGSTRAIGKVDPATGTITKYTTGLNSFSVLTVIVSGSDGNLWFTDGGATRAIGKVDPSTGAITEYSTGLNSSNLPNYIVDGPDGNLWFTDNGSTKAIGKIDPSTGTITEYSMGSGSGNLYNIVLGPDGNLWSGNYGTSTIYRVNPSTGVVTAYPTDVMSYMYPNFFIVAGPDGNLWFTDSYTPAIGKVYAVVPAVTAVSPADGPVTGGTTVTITGSGFTGTTSVSFGGVPASSFTVDSAISITAISPAHDAGTVDVTVTTPGGTSATGSADQFTYTSPLITTGTISGTVKDSNNNLVSGATVSLTVSGSVYSAQTAADGAYSILNIPAGTDYTVTTSKAGFQDRIVSGVTVTAGSTTTGVDFILYTAVEDSSISPTSATFDKNSANTGAGHYADIPVTIAFNGNTLLSILNGSVPLVENTDYTVSGSVYSISKTYLVGQSLGTTTLTFNFSADSPQSLTVTIGDSTPTTHTVSISANPPAGGSVSGGGTFNDGASVTVTANANSGYSFVSWTESGAQVSTNAAYTFTVGAADRTLVANFAASSTPSSGGDGGGGGSSSTPQPVNSTTGSAMVYPSAGGKVSLGSEASVTIPAGAIKGSEETKVEVTRTDSPPASPSGFMLLGQVFEFKVGGAGSYNFNQPVTLTFTFDPSKLASGETPAVYYYDQTKGQWVNIGGTVSGNTITVTVDHFTKYAVLFKETAPPAQKPSAVLTDIAGHWAEKSIRQLVSQGVITGYPDGGFKPDKTITRAEFAALLVKAFKIESKTGKEFKDTANHWAKDFIAAAAASGIVNGYDAATFGPDDPITREQVAVMVIKAAKLASASGETSFADSTDISPWAKGSVMSAVKAGIMEGYPDSTFKPRGNTTRAEAVTVILSSIGSSEKE